MYSLAKFASRTGRIGRPLPDPYGIFAVRNVRFRSGGTSMIAGKPGSFKSVFALNLMTRWVRAEKSVIYFSADSDEFTVARRISGILTGTPQEKIEHDFNRKDYSAYTEALQSLGSARFEYRTSREGIDDVASRMAAYEAVHGDYPDVVFIDNLVNYAPSAHDFGAMIDLLVEADALSRETGSHICVLHHASRDRNYGGPCDPVPVEAIQGKVDQIPRLVLTTAANETAMAVACVKNTNGPQWPDASRFMRFQVEPSLNVVDVADYQEGI